MIIYFDTSALIKLVVEEPGSRQAETIWDRAETLVAARIGFVEARAALAAARRAKRLSPSQHRQAVAGFSLLWAQVSAVELTADLAILAAELAEKHALRGYDAVHLGAAHVAGADVLVSADLDLCRAAAASGLHTANPTGD